MEENVKITP